jgi:hypothetical protein
MDTFKCSITKKPPYDISKIDFNTLIEASREVLPEERVIDQHPMCVEITRIIFNHDMDECANELHPLTDLNYSHVCHRILKKLYMEFTWMKKAETVEIWIKGLLAKQYPPRENPNNLHIV